MEFQYQTSYEKLMQDLQEKGQVSEWNTAQTTELQLEINKQMSVFNIDKQRKSASSEKHASEIILTA